MARVAVIGAGLAGLGAARVMNAAGHDVVVLEKSKGFGGRAATRRIGPYIFDSGATIVSPTGSELLRVMTEELDTSELISVTKPIYMHSFGRITVIDPQRGAPKRFCYQNGMNTLGKLLAEGLHVKTETLVEKIEKDGKGFRVLGESFDGVILTAPLPQSENLLEGSGLKARLGNSRYRQCLSVLLAFDRPLDKPYHALIDPDQSEPLTWLSLETVKVPGDFRAPAGHSAVVAQMSARYSRYSFEKSDETIVRETVVDVSRILGSEFSNPVASGVMRWKYSHVSNTLSYESVNEPGSRLLVASDGLIGARVQQAFDIGCRAGRQMIEELK